MAEAAQLRTLVLSWDYLQVDDQTRGRGMLKGGLPKVPLQFGSVEVRTAAGRQGRVCSSTAGATC